MSCALDEAAAALTRMRSEPPGGAGQAPANAATAAAAAAAAASSAAASNVSSAAADNERSLVEACNEGDINKVKDLIKLEFLVLLAAKQRSRSTRKNVL